VTAFRVPARVAHVVTDDESVTPGAVYLMTLPDGPPVVLRDSAALIWMVAADGEDDVVTVVADLVELPPEEVSADVERFLDELVDLGVLEVAVGSDLAHDGP
jgi:hypothetical protein